MSFDSSSTYIYITLLLSVSGSGQYTNLWKAYVSTLTSLECHSLSVTVFGDYVNQFTFDSNNKLYMTGMFFRDLTTFWIISNAKIDITTGTTDWQMQYDDSAATAQGMNIDGVISYLSSDGKTIYYGVSLTTSENYFFYWDTTNGYI